MVLAHLKQVWQHTGQEPTPRSADMVTVLHNVNGYVCICDTDAWKLWDHKSQ